MTGEGEWPEDHVQTLLEYRQKELHRPSCVGLQSALAYHGMIPLACRGGTALRFLFRLTRFSEDLDSALEGPGRSSL